MDGFRFDQWARNLTSGPNRRQVLAASAAALAGLTLSRELGTARKRKNRKKNEEKVKVCYCASNLSSTCSTTKVKKKNVFFFVIQNPCSYEGPCISGVTMCPMF